MNYRQRYFILCSFLLLLAACGSNFKELESETRGSHKPNFGSGSCSNPLYYVTLSSTPKILVFDRNSIGDVAPLMVLVPDRVGESIYIDYPRKEIYLANIASSSIAVYELPSATGNLTLKREIVGPNTALNEPVNVTLDTERDVIWVSSTASANIQVYSRLANGNVAPERTVTGFFGNGGPRHVHFDYENDEAYITNRDSVNGGNNLFVFSIEANSSSLPLRSLYHPNFNFINAIALDKQKNEVVIAGENGVIQTLSFYNQFTEGSPNPLRTIESGSIYSPLGLVIDTDNDEIIWTNNLAHEIIVYDRWASGAGDSPKRSIHGTNTQLEYPTSIVKVCP